MSNRRDGGLVILGVDDKTLDAVGLNDKDLATWSNYDVLSASVNQYTNPSVSFDLDPPLIYKSKNIIIIQVREFDEIPILCSQDYGVPSKNAPTLRRGACYVRSRNKPETAEIPSQEEMRELLELAVDKGVRRFITRAQKAGLFGLIPSAPAPQGDEELFRRQIEDIG